MEITGLEIKKKRKELGLTQKQLAEKLGVSGNTIINWERGDTIPQSKKQLLYDFINQKTQYYTIEKNEKEIEVKYLDAETSTLMNVPLITQYAYAGYLGGYSDPEYVETLPTIPFVLDREYKGEYLCFEVKGDSMECDNDESIPEGSILLCRNVRRDYWKSKLHINKWDFVIVHNTDGILVKRIINHNVETGEIIIRSLNDFYPDKTLNLQNISQIFNIVEVRSKRKRR